MALLDERPQRLGPLPVAAGRAFMSPTLTAAWRWAGER